MDIPEKAKISTARPVFSHANGCEEELLEVAACVFPMIRGEHPTRRFVERDHVMILVNHRHGDASRKFDRVRFRHEAERRRSLKVAKDQGEERHGKHDAAGHEFLGLRKAHGENHEENDHDQVSQRSRQAGAEDAYGGHGENRRADDRGDQGGAAACLEKSDHAPDDEENDVNPEDDIGHVEQVRWE